MDFDLPLKWTMGSFELSKGPGAVTSVIRKSMMMCLMASSVFSASLGSSEGTFIASVLKL